VQTWYAGLITLFSSDALILQQYTRQHKTRSGCPY